MRKELYKKGSGTHRNKGRAAAPLSEAGAVWPSRPAAGSVRLWQYLCMLTHFIDEEMYDCVDTHIWRALHLGNLPTTRQYLELFAVRFVLRFPERIRARLIQPIKAFNGTSAYICSLLRALASAIKHLGDRERSELLPEVMAAVAPWLTAHHHSLRGFAQVMVHGLLKDFPPHSPAWSQRIQAPGAGEVEMSADVRYLACLYEFLEENTDCSKIREVVEKQLEWCDPAEACTPQGILCHDVGLSSTSSGVGEPVELPFEGAPTPLLDRVASFLFETRQNLRSTMAENEVHYVEDKMGAPAARPAPAASVEPGFQRKVESQLTVAAAAVAGGTAFNDEVLTFETPPIADDHEQLMLEAAVGSSRLAAVGQYGRMARQELIVVASLIDKIPNLAGLARTCEVFQAASLVSLASACLGLTWQQQSLASACLGETASLPGSLASVTAEKWIPVLEVKEHSLDAFLRLKQSQGFSLVGLEQTTTSCCITEYDFPKKTVLVLGREKEGIPVEMIQMLDACVEIPQLGMIRSLNVHVTAAIAIYHYTKQMLKTN
ncbi:hypothetical protein CYMTET_28280 [Cymbomonas tetramitiformis]|uniref:tRNA/rRNA methyltransferase SpoU type domain-containing protein n=1 Tax=Cymbomonas tetramitiformis TaxID=36881 RepID=A0AAE0KW37_9CHLO|nr:hypothetical protein CYMTET_28280 [Cymbomonas tetramitiformis]